MRSKLNHSKGVILWDIDGTIISPIRKIVNSPHANTVIKHGIEPNGRSEVLIGSTDYEVLEDLMENYKGENKFSLLDTCFKELDKESLVLYGQNSFELCLGMPEVLIETSKLGWDNGVLTGNTYIRMIMKLSNVLDKFDQSLLFECKFGDSREKIARRASESFKFNETKNVIIVGDTPRDISVAKEFNFQAVSVASGKFSTEELKKFDPNLLLKDFKSDSKLFLKFISSFD
jgi:phosphoglycolate phosphatase-like HAD superfamily hydrolase